MSVLLLNSKKGERVVRSLSCPAKRLDFTRGSDFAGIYSWLFLGRWETEL